MSKEIFLIHRMTFQPKDLILDLFALRDDNLYLVDYKYVIEYGIKKWHLVVSAEAICPVKIRENIVTEFHSKDIDKGIIPGPDISSFYFFDEVKNTPGSFFPRIFRPSLILDKSLLILDPHFRLDHIEATLRKERDYLPAEDELILTGVTQLSSLVENLKAICRHIHPNGRNYNVYGNEIRNQFILACTEVEAQLVGIYRANSTWPSARPTMKDYVLLQPHLKLEDYSVLYNLYPYLDSFRPFGNWNSKDPTASIQWYQDYHAVKHDREVEFPKATLGNLVYAIAALAILLKAQYGDKILFWDELIGDFFRFCETPSWTLEEYYLPPLKGQRWSEKKVLQ